MMSLIKKGCAVISGAVPFCALFRRTWAGSEKSWVYRTRKIVALLTLGGGLLGLHADIFADPSGFPAALLATESYEKYGTADS